GTQRYYVVHFVKENTVEVVPEQWVEKRDGSLISCCYWPRNASATMIKRGDRPDKILWEKQLLCGRATSQTGVNTSNVESDEEPAKRAVTKPIRFRVEPPDDDGSEALQKKTNEPRQAQLTVPHLPPAPSDLQAVEMRIMVELEMIRTEFRTALNQVMEAIEARQPKESESLGQLEMLQNPAETNEELKDICDICETPFKMYLFIRYLTLCCCLDLGSGIRQMMRKIGTEE
ncbi:unnamed protein product, partial [Coregonus sp. 'balchen']